MADWFSNIPLIRVLRGEPAPGEQPRPVGKVYQSADYDAAGNRRRDRAEPDYGEVGEVEAFLAEGGANDLGRALKKARKARKTPQQREAERRATAERKQKRQQQQQERRNRRQKEQQARATELANIRILRWRDEPAVFDLQDEELPLLWAIYLRPEGKRLVFWANPVTKPNIWVRLGEFDRDIKGAGASKTHAEASDGSSGYIGPDGYPDFPRFVGSTSTDILKNFMIWGSYRPDGSRAWVDGGWEGYGVDPPETWTESWGSDVSTMLDPQVRPLPRSGNQRTPPASGPLVPAGTDATRILSDTWASDTSDVRQIIGIRADFHRTDTYSWLKLENVFWEWPDGATEPTILGPNPTANSFWWFPIRTAAITYSGQSFIYDDLPLGAENGPGNYGPGSTFEETDDLSPWSPDTNGQVLYRAPSVTVSFVRKQSKLHIRPTQSDSNNSSGGWGSIPALKVRINPERTHATPTEVSGAVTLDPYLKPAVGNQYGSTVSPGDFGSERWKVRFDITAAREVVPTSVVALALRSLGLSTAATGVRTVALPHYGREGWNPREFSLVGFAVF